MSMTPDEVGEAIKAAIFKTIGCWPPPVCRATGDIPHEVDLVGKIMKPGALAKTLGLPDKPWSDDQDAGRYSIREIGASLVERGIQAIIVGTQDDEGEIIGALIFRVDSMAEFDELSALLMSWRAGPPAAPDTQAP